MKKFFTLITLIIFSGVYMAEAQVGIGNATPDSTSVLDLTNPDNNGILLPKSDNTSSMSETVGMTYYNNDFIYYKQSDGYNALSPWKFKFNGNLTNNIYYNLDGNIGIGISDITISPLAPIQIETNMPIDLIENGSFLIGKSTNTNLVFNSEKIQARNNGSSSDLTINEHGGDVILGSEAHPVNIKATNKIQRYHQPTQTYYDLMPVGGIIIWYGNTSNIPTGWALCDGNDYPLSDNSGNITTPNLSGNFIVSVGDNGGSIYTAHDTNGQDAVALTLGEMPYHNHSGSANSGGSHSHDLEADATSYSGGSSSGNGGDGKCNKINKTNSAGTHSHTVYTYNTGGNLPHENRPKYYALAYIIKL